MDFQLEELQALTLTDVLRESVTIPRASPRTFGFITLALVFPLSFAILAHSLFTHPLLLRLQSPQTFSGDSSAWALLVLYQFLYLLLLFTFSLLSTAAVVFTVGSLYAAKPVSFRSTCSAIRPIFPRLFRTFLWISLIMLLYNFAFALAILLLFISDDSGPSVLAVAIVLLLFLAVHVYISALWHLASVISVLEPVCGLPAMTKSRELLSGRVRMASVLVVGYLGACGAIGWAFRAMVVKGAEEEGSIGISVGAKVLVGGALVAVLVVVNLVGLLVQSVFYYVCKSYHHQGIDRNTLYDHLGGYLGEYVPLKSSIQMENL